MALARAAVRRRDAIGIALGGHGRARVIGVACDRAVGGCFRVDHVRVVGGCLRVDHGPVSRAPGIGANDAGLTPDD